jgi:hypothetical protein
MPSVIAGQDNLRENKMNPMRQFTLLLLLVVSSRAQAQIIQSAPQGEGGSLQDQITRFTVGGHIDYTEPKEEFRENVGHGWGAGGSVRYNLDRRGILSLRFDGGGAAYGRETKRVPLSNTVGGRILVDVVTTNSLFSFALGSQLTVPVGAVRPYANVAFAGIGFETNSSVSGTDFADEDFASSENYSDATTALVLGSGLYIPLGRQISIDVGVRYHRGGQASYLREGSIQDNSDGSITITPLQSRTPFMVYTLGVSYQISRKSLRPCPRLLC